MPEVTVGPASGYLAVPAESRGPWPGVVVIHESWGLNGDIRAHAGHSFMSTKPAVLAPLARLARLARPDYRPESAGDSWQRILAFFGEHRSDPAPTS